MVITFKEKVMRCQACNVALSDYESTKKSATSGEYLDLCNNCFSSVETDIDIEDRGDLGSGAGVEPESDE
jgi:hypothetical protein